MISCICDICGTSFGCSCVEMRDIHEGLCDGCWHAAVEGQAASEDSVCDADYYPEAGCCDCGECSSCRSDWASHKEYQQRMEEESEDAAPAELPECDVCGDADGGDMWYDEALDVLGHPHCLVRLKAFDPAGRPQEMDILQESYMLDELARAHADGF